MSYELEDKFNSFSEIFVYNKNQIIRKKGNDRNLSNIVTEF